MNKKLLTGIIIGLAVITGTAYITLGGNSTEEEGDINYSFAKVEQGDIVIDFMSDGQIDIPIEEYTFNTSGNVKSIDVVVGQEVVVGDVLASIDTDSIEQSLAEAELSLESAIINKDRNSDSYNKNYINYNYQLNSLKTNYETLKATFDDMTALSSVYAANDIVKAKENYEKALNDYDNYKLVNVPVSSSDSDIITVEKAVLQVEELKADLENSNLTAKSNGTIITINSQPGENITTSQVVTKIEGSDHAYVVASIQEIDILNVELGQKAYIEVEAMLGSTLEATVITIDRDPIIDNNGIVYYNVVLELTDKNSNIMDGMTVTSTFVILEKLDIIKIPNKAVKIVNSKQVVTVSTGENSAEERVIVTGLTDGRNVEVISGLEVGEKLIYEN